MKYILLPENKRYYKANLHCHSVLSDGVKTVEELKQDYMAYGYSIVAFTDHDIFITHNDLTDENFLALNGYEIEVNKNTVEPGESSKTCHICLVAKNKNIETPVCFHRSDYLFGNAKDNAKYVKFDPNLSDYIREYTPESVNDMIKKGKEKGFFVTYNHPVWSLEFYNEYSKYEGMDAMEIVNFSCVNSGFDDDNGHVYEELLRQGKRLYCIAADDNHNRHGDEEPYCDSYGGYIMIASDKLEYTQIISSLEKGYFYSSTGNYKHTGPEILSLALDGNKLTIKTSDVRAISFLSNKRQNKNVLAFDGKTINEATFEIDENSLWFRLTVTDAQGYKAYTNAYFINDLERFKV